MNCSVKKYREYLISKYKDIEDFNWHTNKMDELQLLGMLCYKYPNSVIAELKELYYNLDISEIVYIKAYKLYEVMLSYDNSRKIFNCFKR